VEVGGARFVGFSWPDADPKTEDHAVFMRARTQAGWSGWREVEQAGDGPDATSSGYRPGLAYSDGQWLDAGTEEVQVRVDPPEAMATSGAGVEERQAAAATMAAGGIEAHLITPDLTATPGTEAPRAGVATAATAQPRIISRAAWGAKESIRRASPDYSGTVKAAFVHHTVQSNRYSPSESAALIRSDYLYHVRTRGWNDIGYNFLVDRYGRVFEGRYGGITRAVLGAHSGGFNTNSTGVALLGTFTTAAPPARMLAALERLLAWKLDLTHVDPNGRTVLRSAGGANTRYRAGREVVVNTIMGHRSTSYTTCPGDPTIARLGAIRRAVARIGRPKIYNGYASSSLISPEQGGYTGVHARFSGVVRWRVTVTRSDGVRIRSYSGEGSSATVRWNGRVTGGGLAPQGWATITMTAAAGGASARPAPSRVFVNRTVAPSGTSTGGFTAGSWRVSNANAEQRSTSAPVFTSYRWGSKGDIPVVGDWDGDGSQTVGVVRPSAARDSNQLLLRNSNGSVVNFWYGRKGDRLVMPGLGRRDGTWTPGILRNGTHWYLKNSLTAGPSKVSLRKQTPGRPVVGNWDNRP
jgi:N-acetylmuramoyl-L-alanine amidase